MNYYFSLILAIGITTLTSPPPRLSIESRNSQTHDEYQLVAQVPETDVDSSLNNQPESPVEPETNKVNKNLLLAAIAVTSLFTIFLLFLLFKKVEVNLEDEIKEEVKEKITEEVAGEKLAHQEAVEDNWQEEDSLDNEKDRLNNKEKTILQMPEISQNGSISNHKLSEQEQFQDDTVIVPLPKTAQIDVVYKLILELRSTDRQSRQETIAQLAQNGDSRAMIPLVKLIKKADSQERSLILGAIKKITNNTLKTMNQALILSLGNEYSQIEPNTIRDLNRVYELMTEATERLSQTINAPEPKVQETTEWALKQLKKMPAIPELKITKN